MSERLTCRLRFLDGITLHIPITLETRTPDLISVCYRSLDIDHSNMFGVSFQRHDGSECWLDDLKPVLQHGLLVQLDSNQSLAVSVTFRVRFFVPSPWTLSCAHQRSYVFLEIVERLKTGCIRCTSMEQCATLALLAHICLRSTIAGPATHYDLLFDALLSHTSHDLAFALQDEQRHAITHATAQKYAHLSPLEAERDFLIIAPTCVGFAKEYYPLQINQEDVMLGVGPTGIELSRIADGPGGYSFIAWKDVVELSFNHEFVQLHHQVEFGTDSKLVLISCLCADVAAARRTYYACYNHNLFATSLSLNQASDTESTSHAAGPANNATSSSPSLGSSAAASSSSPPPQLLPPPPPSPPPPQQHHHQHYQQQQQLSLPPSSPRLATRVTSEERPEVSTVTLCDRATGPMATSTDDLDLDFSAIDQFFNAIPPVDPATVMQLSSVSLVDDVQAERDLGYGELHGDENKDTPDNGVPTRPSLEEVDEHFSEAMDESMEQTSCSMETRTENEESASVTVGRTVKRVRSEGGEWQRGGVNCDGGNGVDRTREPLAVSSARGQMHKAREEYMRVTADRIKEEEAAAEEDEEEETVEVEEVSEELVSPALQRCHLEKETGEETMNGMDVEETHVKRESAIAAYPSTTTKTSPLAIHSVDSAAPVSVPTPGRAPAPVAAAEPVPAPVSASVSGGNTTKKTAVAAATATSRRDTTKSVSGTRRKVTVPPLFECPLCPFTSTVKRSVKDHLAEHAVKQPYACDFDGCNRRYSRGEDLQRHKSSHMGKPQFVCAECGKGFQRGDKLKSHQSTHALVEDRVRYWCSVQGCTSCFSRKDALCRHLRTIHNISLPVTSTKADV